MRIASQILAAMVVALTVSGAAAQPWKPGQRIPSTAEVFGTTLTPEADKFLTESNLQFNEKQQRLDQEWLRNYSRYDVDFPRGELRITRPDVIVVFDIQLIGSVQSRDKSWEWAWNNPSIPTHLSAASALVRPVGEKFNLRYLSHGMISVPDYEQFPWFLSGVALKLNPKAVGVYRGTSEGMQFFFLLFNPRERKL